MIEANIKRRMHGFLPMWFWWPYLNFNRQRLSGVHMMRDNVFGENRSRELLEIPLRPKDIQWHFIGHLD